MTKDSIAVINDHEYKYRWDRESKKMLYRGPVGNAPLLSQDQFRTAVLNQQQQKEFQFYMDVAETLDGKVKSYDVKKSRELEFYDSVEKFIGTDHSSRIVEIDDIKDKQLQMLDPEGGPLDKQEPWVSKVTIIQTKFNEPPGGKNDFIKVDLFSFSQGIGQFEVVFEMKRKGRETSKKFVERMMSEATEKVRSNFPDIY